MYTLLHLAEQVGLSASTLRNYEKQGLIVKNAQGFFEAGAVHRVREIQQLKAQGLALSQIAVHFGASDPQGSNENTADVEALKSKILGLRAKLLEQKQQLQSLQEKNQRVVMQRNELRLNQQEVEELERLRRQSVARAVEVKGRAARLQYATHKPKILKLDPNAKRKPR